MAFILDASVAVAWMVGKQATAYSRGIRLRARREPYHTPALWRQEVVNVIRSLMRRRALSAAAGRTAVDILERMQPVLHDTALSLPDLLDLASRCDVTAYHSWLSEIFTPHPASARSGKRTATTASIQMLG